MATKELPEVAGNTEPKYRVYSRDGDPSLRSGRGYYPGSERQ